MAGAQKKGIDRSNIQKRYKNALNKYEIMEYCLIVSRSAVRIDKTEWAMP